MNENVVARALDANAASLALAHEVFDADGARFVRDRRVPLMRAANYVSRVTVSSPPETDRLLARAAAEYAGFPHMMFECDFRTPPAFEARLLLDGYLRNESILMLLEGALIGAAKPCQIRLAESEADWQALGALNRLQGLEAFAKPDDADEPEAVTHETRRLRLKSPPFRYWLAYEDGAPRGFFSSWEGISGMGHVESLFVQRESRHRGIATALLHHAVADVRAHGAGPVLIVCDPADTPKRLYAAMGWRPVAITRRYRKALA